MLKDEMYTHKKEEYDSDILIRLKKISRFWETKLF